MPQPKRSIERDGMKLCLGCNTARELRLFQRDKRDNTLRARCNECAATALRERRAAGRKPRPTLLQRIVRRTVPGPGGCLTWAGTVNGHGYGAIQAGMRSASGNQRQSVVHRVAWALLVGPVPDGLELDHLCFNRRCWNPAHLEPVTRSENSRRARAREIALYGRPVGGRRPLRNGAAA